MHKEILRVSHLCKRIKNTVILNDFSMNLYEGEVLGIMGLRDSGKTLLFHILSGKEEFDSGTLFFDENKLSGNRVMLRDKIALVKKESSLLKNLTITDNIFHIRKHYHWQFWIHKRLYRNRAKEELMKIGIMTDPDVCISELTQIECYMIEIMKRYIMGAKIIILDDFSEERSMEEILRLNELIEGLKNKGVSFIVAGYQLQNLQMCSERILFLVNGSDGKVILNKKRKQIDENLIFRTLPPMDKQKTNREKQKEIFRVEALSSGKIKNLSFSLYQGEILTLVDFERYYNQSLFQSLMNLEQVKKEEILFVDFNLKNKIIEQMSLRDNLCLGNFYKVSWMGFYRKKSMEFIKKDFLSWYPSEQLRKAKDCRNLSEKDKMAILLYRIRMKKPQMIFCVDPSRYTDALTYRMMQEQLLELAENGTAVLILAQNVERNYQLTDRFLFWEKGELIEKGLKELIEK